MRQALLALVLACAMGACRSREEPSRAAPPPTRPARRTTDPGIVLRNMDAQIDGLGKALSARGGADPTVGVQLVDALLDRGHVRGRVADMERSLELAEAMAAANPRSIPALVARARARQTLHLFDEALADLDQAAALGARGEIVDAPRATVLQATGRGEAALELRLAIANGHPTILSLGALAALHAERGEAAEAARRFEEAAAAYRDVSPAPLAWLELQEGLFREGQGDRALARELYQRAHDRLPAHAEATSHLAGLLAREGDTARAIALLEPVVAASDDPNFAVQLSTLLGQAGRTGEAAALYEKARARALELAARHPAAFADHAARFTSP